MIQTIQNMWALAALRDVARKKRENVGILKKQEGGGPTQIPLPFFTVFNMGDLPTKIPSEMGVALLP